MTDSAGTVTDTIAYDAYGKQTARTGTSDIIFCYNGRYGVVTEPSGLVYMRARYYSPELRRFVNADVVAGNISNAITLNRYAYANGNPISNVDPLGLKSLFSYIWDELNGRPREERNLLKKFTEDFLNGVRDWAAKAGEEINEALKEAFKEIENGALQIESALNIGSNDIRIEQNLGYNSQIDIKNQIISNQDAEPYSNLRLGDQSIADNGCEVIAVNNAMNLLKYDTSMANLIYTFETSGAVVGGSLIGGAFGSNPYSLPKVFDELGLGYKTVSIDEMGKNGVYIISYWNSSNYGSMIHTIAIEKKDIGYELYNLSGNYSKADLNIDVNDLSKYENGFIAGYEVFKPERK